MDILEQLAKGWAALVLSVDPGITPFVFRAGGALLIGLLLSRYAVRRAVFDEESLRLRQIAVVAATVLSLFTLPAQWMLTFSGEI